MDKVDVTETDKSEWIKLWFLMDLENLASKYSRHFAMAFREIENLMPMKKPTDKDASDFVEGSRLILF
jgi:hypothetical protein